MRIAKCPEEAVEIKMQQHSGIQPPGVKCHQVKCMHKSVKCQWNDGKDGYRREYCRGILRNGSERPLAERRAPLRILPMVNEPNQPEILHEVAGEHRGRGEREIANEQVRREKKHGRDKEYPLGHCRTTPTHANDQKAQKHTGNDQQNEAAHLNEWSHQSRNSSQILLCGIDEKHGTVRRQKTDGGGQLLDRMVSACAMSVHGQDAATLTGDMKDVPHCHRRCDHQKQMERHRRCENRQNDEGTAIKRELARAVVSNVLIVEIEDVSREVMWHPEHEEVGFHEEGRQQRLLADRVSESRNQQAQQRCQRNERQVVRRRFNPLCSAAHVGRGEAASSLAVAISASSKPASRRTSSATG